MSTNIILSVKSVGNKVSKLQTRLKQLGYDISVDGIYGPETRTRVREFQINATYALDGALLPVHGSVDTNTWNLLFAYEVDNAVDSSVSPVHKPSGIYSSPILKVNTKNPQLSPLGKSIIKYAKQEVGTKEVGTNGGKRVNEYLDAVGLKGTRAPWCMAFVMWCYLKAAQENGIKVIWEKPRSLTLQKSGHVQGYRNWARSKGILITNHELALPASFFVMVFSGGSGHTGVILTNDKKNKKYITVEGNTNNGGSREGDGVYLKERRYNTISSIIQFPEIYISQ